MRTVCPFKQHLKGSKLFTNNDNPCVQISTLHLFIRLTCPSNHVRLVVNNNCTHKKNRNAQQRAWSITYIPDALIRPIKICIPANSI